ncbi:MAG: 16S rRNA (guanine(527)-N(7))-methyltransferase RsmG [Wenzhouxiangella sp.]
MSEQPLPSSSLAEQSQAEMLATGLQQMGISADQGRQRQLLAYLALLQRWNEAYNLTAVTDPVAMVARHLLDSLSILPALEGRIFLDAGTGAGLPGVPLAIARPDCRFVLLDSNGKKVRFLRQVRRELKLDNIEPVQGRLESYRMDPPPDALLTRALAPLERLVAWSAHWLDLGIPLLAMKSDRAESEIRDVPEPYNVRLEELRVPGLCARRCLAIVEKR